MNEPEAWRLCDALNDLDRRAGYLMDLAAAIGPLGLGSVEDAILRAKVDLLVARDMVRSRLDASARPRRGSFICTFTGRKYWPMDPRVEDVHTDDIAHALSLKCRFTGHTSRLYTVAEHTIRVVAIVRAALLFGWGPCADLPAGADPEPYAWLHDAEEAYLPDVSRPVKRSLYEWPEIAARNEAVILEAFHLPPPSPEVAAVVAWADDVALVLEARALFSFDLASMGSGFPPLNAPPAVLDAPGVAVSRVAAWDWADPAHLALVLREALDNVADQPERVPTQERGRSWRSEVAEGRVDDPEAEMRRRGLLD